MCTLHHKSFKIPNHFLVLLLVLKKVVVELIVVFVKVFLSLVGLNLSS